MTTDEGIVGWAETYDWHTSASLETALQVMGRRLIGEDPRRIELMNEKIWYGGRPGVPERREGPRGDGPRAVGHQGEMAGRSGLRVARRPVPRPDPAVLVALRDVPGGLARGRRPEPTSTYAEWAAGARDVVAQGYKVLKTNLIAEGGPDGKARLPSYLDGAIDHRTIDDAVTWIGTLRDVVGPSIGIAVDVQFDYRMGGIVKLARALEPFDLYWLEVESLDPDALLAAREQTTTRLCHGESLIRREQFRPFFRKHVTDVVMIETLSNGLSESRRIAEMAELYDTMISPHNWMSPLGTLINAQLCAAVSNVEILEIDIDDVPWKGDLLTHPLEIENGQLVVSDRPGWGADIVEEVVRAHPLRPSACREDHRHRADHLRQRHRRP